MAAGAVMPAGSYLSPHIYKIIQERLHSLQAACAVHEQAPSLLYLQPGLLQ